MSVDSVGRPNSPSSVGVLRIRVVKANNLVKHDLFSDSDPYVEIIMGKQIGQTSIKNNDNNPTWNEDFDLSLKDITAPIILTMYDWDRFTRPDKMGDAELDIKPLLECSNMKEPQSFRDGTEVSRVQPTPKNCLAHESSIVWKNAKLTQDITLKLRNAKRGVLQIQLELLK